MDARDEEYERRESGYSLDSIIKMTFKFFRSYEIQASVYLNIPKPFCVLETIVHTKINKTIIFYGAFQLIHMKLIYIVKDCHIGPKVKTMLIKVRNNFQGKKL